MKTGTGYVFSRCVFAALVFFACVEGVAEPLNAAQLKAVCKKYFGAEAPRRLPLLEIKTENVIYAKDFGVLPDSSECSVAALAKLMDHARASSPCRVIFEKGVYRLNGPLPESKNFAVNLSNMKDVWLQGNGSALMVGDPLCGVFSVHGSERVIIEGFRIDYNPLPHSAGRVEKIDPETGEMELSLLDGVPPMDTPHLKDSPWGFFLDADVPGRLAEARQNVYYHTKIEKNSDTRFKIFFDLEKSPPVELGVIGAGEIYTINIRPNACVGGLYRTKDVTFKDIEINATPGSSFSGVGNDAPNFINCRLVMLPGRRRIANSDTFHFQNSVTGPWIENCVSDGVADDAVNVYIRPNYLVKNAGPRALRVAFSPDPAGFENAKFGKYDYSAGDRVAFFDGATKTIIAENEIEKVDVGAGILTFKKPLPELSFGPDKLANSTIYNISFSKGVVIKNSVFKNSRRYGIYLKGSRALICGNTFEGLSAEGIIVANEPGWPEGLKVENAVIANNTFKNCGFERHHLYARERSTIRILAEHAQNAHGYFPHKNIYIGGNTFEAWRKGCIYARNVENLEISGNDISVPRQTAEGGPDGAAIDVKNCANLNYKNGKNSAPIEDSIRDVD